jgi:thiamine-monophosphate kinase
MILSDVGEFDLIKKIVSQFGGGFRGHLQNILGIGDDCAIFPKNDLPISESSGSGACDSYLISTDMIIEGTHFLLDRISPEALGHKTLAVNLSDIAAMGGEAKFSFLSMALPSTLSVEWLEKFFSSYHALSRKYSIALLGGDTTRSLDRICLNVTVVGEMERKNAKLRSHARVGDKIYVTDNLGDSAAGFKSEIAPLLIKHNWPQPQLDEGRFFSRASEVHAMMDLSDGLDSDIKHILEQSGCGAKIDLEKIPLSKELLEYQCGSRTDSYKFAIGGGEDYCLLLTCDYKKAETLTKNFQARFNRPLFEIGEIIAGPPEIKYFESGEEISKDRSKLFKGFRHFES